MGVRNATVQSNTLVASPSGSGETLICQAGPLNLIFDNATVLIHAFVELVIGTSGNLCTMSLRRGGTITSPLVNVGSGATVVAGSRYRFAMNYFDTPGIVAGLIYNLDLTIGAAAAASTVADVCLIAEVL